MDKKRKAEEKRLRRIQRKSTDPSGPENDPLIDNAISGDAGSEIDEAEAADSEPATGKPIITATLDNL